MIIFMGLAGSGKSTMGHFLAAHLGCPWVSTGNLLREKMDAKTQAEMLQGKIVSDEQTLDVLNEEFRRIGAHNHQFVLDGSPRTMRQAQWLVQKSQSGELKITAVIHLNIDKDAAKERLLARRRPDDHEQAITERFSEYDEAIVPILDYLKSEGCKVHEINAAQPPHQVESDIAKALGIEL
jgi:adenylate kinase